MVPLKPFPFICRGRKHSLSLLLFFSLSWNKLLAIILGDRSARERTNEAYFFFWFANNYHACYSKGIFFFAVAGLVFASLSTQELVQKSSVNLGIFTFMKIRLYNVQTERLFLHMKGCVGLLDWTDFITGKILVSLLIVSVIQNHTSRSGVRNVHTSRRRLQQV